MFLLNHRYRIIEVREVKENGKIQYGILVIHRRKSYRITNETPPELKQHIPEKGLDARLGEWSNFVKQAIWMEIL